MPLGWSIPFGDMPTVGAFLARVPRIDKDHWYTSERGLVRHALPQLEESPIGVPWSLRAAGLNPLSDTRQIFQGDPSSGALRSIHEPFGDGMVDILLKPGLLALEQLESSPRRSCSMALQAFASGLVSLAFPIHCRARVHCAIRVQGEVDYAKVHAKHPLNSHLFWLQHITDNGQVEGASYVHQIDFALAKGQQDALALSALIPNGHTTLHGPEGERGIRAEAKDTIIVGLRGIALKTPARRAVELVGISDFGNTTHGHLRGKPKLGTTALVGKLVQGELAKRLAVPGFFGQPCTGMVRHPQRVQQRRMLFRSGGELEIRHKFHTFKYRTFDGERQANLLPLWGNLLSSPP